jgi:hypothetical protein
MPRAHRTHAPTTAVAAILAPLLLGLAACGSAEVDRPAGSAQSLFDRRAREVVVTWQQGDLLDRWRAGVIPAQGLTVEPDWTARESLKAAFHGGWVRTATALPTTASRGTVAYEDGTTASVRTLDAQSAFDAMVNPRSGECPTPPGGTGCDWVTVTGARLVTVTIGTARGPAEVPAWSFTVAHLDEPLVRVALGDAAEPGDLEPPLPAAPTDGRRHLLFGQDVVGHTSTSLTVTLGSGDCDSERTKHVLETPEVVVVGGTAVGPPADRACNAMLRLEEVTVPLSSPVGARPVLDAASGRPLLPRVAPTP